MATEPIELDLELTADPASAFELFGERLGDWWPAEYTWAGEVLAGIAIEPQVGGRCFERGPHGFTCDWGRVLAWAPPDHLAFSWQIGPGREPVPDPAKASEVEVAFTPTTDGGTTVSFQHREFDRHGDEGGEYRAALASPQGWPYILDRYRASVETG